MKKNLLIILILLSLLIFPTTVKAEVESNDFQTTINEEIETFKDADGYESYVNILKNTDLSNYTENEDKVNVYVFRGSTCGYCLDAVVYFASIANEYGNKFNLITYEVWSNQDNSNLMNEVAKVFSETVSGVPYIVVGDKTYSGFNESIGSEIETIINEDYAKEDRFDVMDNLGTVYKRSNSELIVSLVMIGLIAGLLTIIYVIKANKKKKTKSKNKKNK